MSFLKGLFGGRESKEPITEEDTTLANPDELEAPFVEGEKRKGVIRPIEVDPNKEFVYVLESKLPYNKEGGLLVPRQEKFSRFTLDKSTLVVADKVATAAELRDPCLLEGETSTSKTSSIEYLAMRTNNEVVRLNLNGQTDTSELIGKFVPNDGKLELEFGQATKHPELLTPESRAILIAANSEGRGLSLLESQKIGKLEGIEAPDWRWQDGIVPKGMKKGWWVILDEINLAEPQVLERINPVIERNPSLTLSELGDQKIEDDAKDPEHRLNPNFRIFATMNPAEYSGRAAMSPAYKDRWTSYIYADPPTEKDYFDMAINTVYGEQPKVQIRNIEYQDGQSTPLEHINEVPNMREFLARLARFEVKLEELARSRQIGKGRKEKYVFTRRGLIEFFEFLSHKTIVDRKEGKTKTIANAPKEVIQRAIQYYFLDKIAGKEDLKKVTDILDAVGISESTWTVEFTEAAEGKFLKEPEEEKKEKEEEREKGKKSFEVGDRVKIASETSYTAHKGSIGEVISVPSDGEYEVKVDRCRHTFPAKHLTKFD
jgi:MoxR-like ATPase